MLLANKDSFTSFPICTPYISFSCLTSLAQTSTSMLTRSDNNWHLDPNLWGKAFNISPLYMMLVVGYLQILFIGWRKFPFIPSLLSVLLWKSDGFVKCFFCLQRAYNLEMLSPTILWGGFSFRYCTL